MGHPLEAWWVWECLFIVNTCEWPSGWENVLNLYSYPSTLDTAPLSIAKAAEEKCEVNL